MKDAIVPKPSRAATELDELHARYRRPLLRYFLRRVGSLAEAEDLTQEVFLRLVRREPSTAIDHKSGFIFTAAVNLIRDRARRLGGRPAEVELAGDEDFAALVEDRAPERVLIGKERLAEVLACLDELPPRTRDSFLLFRVERMRQRDIAKALGVSVSAVEKHIIRATAHLAQRFGRPSHGPHANDA